MKIKTLLLCTSLTLCLGSYAANAQSSGPRYTPRPAVSQNNYTETNRLEDRADIESYERYEEREPCQSYREIPRKFRANCNTTEAPVETAVVETVQTVETVITENRVLPIVQSYTILFDYDKSTVRSDENATLSQITQDISKYNPSQVTVTGYTDSSGKADYNQSLSREREQAVSRALLERGIQNQTLEREARGEYDQAVETADGVKNQDNRRVVVDFRR